MSTEIRRIVRMTFKPEHLPQFLKIFHDSKDKIRAREGCKHLELWQDLHAPHICSTFSIWDSEEHLNAYRDSELFGQVWPATKTLFAEKPVAFSVVQKVTL